MGRKWIGWLADVFLRVAASLGAGSALALVTFIVFVLMAGDEFTQPPRKVYTGTQWTLRALKRAAISYRDDTGDWPRDDAESTFLYKLMGGGRSAPYLQYRHESVCGTCQVFSMTSPQYSPWARGPKGTVDRAPFYLPDTQIQWPAEHGCSVTPYGGSYQIREEDGVTVLNTPAWDAVPDDPAIYPWLAKDVVGFDPLGARYRYRDGLFGYIVYTDGQNLRDNGGHGDDIRASLTPGMLWAYHGACIPLLLSLALAALCVYYWFILRPLWRTRLRKDLQAKRQPAE